MDTTPAQVVEEAHALDNALHRGVIGQHGHHDATEKRHVARFLDQFRSLGHKRLGFALVPVVNPQTIPGLQQMLRYGSTHAPQADESHLLTHLSTSQLLLPSLVKRASPVPACIRTAIWIKQKAWPASST